MAFEAFLTQGQAQSRPRWRRRLMLTVSLIVHAAALAYGVVYSFWHVDELSPPTVRVTFMSATPPPPPPPPPPAGSGAVRKAAVKPRVTPTSSPRPTLVQPTEKEEKRSEPSPPDDDDELPGAVAGGKKGGVIGGTIGGTVGGRIGGTIGGTVGGTVGGEAQAAPKLLPPHMGLVQRAPGAATPEFPASLRKPGAVYLVRAKICVSKTGAVDSVTIIQEGHPLLDASVIKTVRKWPHRPLLANNTPVPFCYFQPFEFKAD